MTPELWHRLERYARWKGKLHWGDLHNDLVILIVSYLDSKEVLILVEAIAGPVQTPLLVPTYIRDVWMRCKLCQSFHDFVHHHISEEVLYKTRGHASSILCMNWSPFSKCPPATRSRILLGKI